VAHCTAHWIEWRDRIRIHGRMSSGSVAPYRWLGVCALTGVALVLLYPGSYFEDPFIHFLRAKWSWSHAWMIVDVWDRPLFTLVYSIPANMPGSGVVAYATVKLTTVAFSVCAAWLTWDIARVYGLERPTLTIPLLWLQPCFFVACGDVAPEVLFALILAVALRLRQRGQIAVSLLTASSLILVRPEGFVVAIAWAWAALADARGPHTTAGRAAMLLSLAIAPALWWYLAAQITLDPLFLVHNWPSLFKPLPSVLVGGGFENIFVRWSKITGLTLLLPFLVGMWTSLRRPEMRFPAAVVLIVFLVHLFAGNSGFFGWAPIPTAFVCVAPAMALVTLDGWNAIAPVLTRFGRRWVLPATAAVALGVGLVQDVVYADWQPPSRDWRAIADVMTWLRAHPQRITRFIWSRAYADVLVGHDPMENPLRFGDREGALAKLTEAEPATLVQWDGDVGPASYHVSGDELAQRGLVTLRRSSYALSGWLPTDSASPGLAALRSILRVPPDHLRPVELWLLQRP
jgi:hypothetical protein